MQDILEGNDFTPIAVFFFIFSAFQGVLIRIFLNTFKISIPDVVILLILGVMWGFIARESSFVERHILVLSEHRRMLSNLAIPVLIFHRAMTLDYHSMMRSFGQVFIIACPVFLIRSILVGIIMKFFLNFDCTYPQAVVVGMFMCIVFPANVVDRLKSVGTKTKHLVTLMEAESVLTVGCFNLYRTICQLFAQKISDDFTFTNILIGNTIVKYDNEIIRIGETDFALTNGLKELLFRSNPQVYSEEDLKNYKFILYMISAHKRGYDAKASINANRHIKYKTIISNLFPPKRSCKNRQIPSLKDEEIPHILINQDQMEGKVVKQYVKNSIYTDINGKELRVVIPEVMQTSHSIVGSQSDEKKNTSDDPECQANSIYECGEESMHSIYEYENSEEEYNKIETAHVLVDRLRFYIKQCKLNLSP